MFARFARELDGSGRSAVMTAVVGAVVLAAWAAWFFLARVSVYEVSASARLEVERAPHEVDAPVGGRVVKSALVLGQEVRAGDVLVELDADTFRLERDTERTRLVALQVQVTAAGRERSEEQQALRGEGAVVAASVEEARARERASRTVTRLKEQEQKQLEALRAANAVADLETDRTRAEAESQAAETQALHSAVGRLGTERAVRRSDRRAKMARQELEIARLEGERALAESRIRVLEKEIALRTIRAPIDGRVGHAVTLRPGSVIDAGTRIAVVVPSGALRAVAFHDPATALGRVRPGQRARLRMDGFPWTNYGTLQATVSRVGNEPDQGRIRVELVLIPEPGTRIPLQHGLGGVAEIEVDRATPASLVLDAAGRFLMRSDG